VKWVGIDEAKFLYYFYTITKISPVRKIYFDESLVEEPCIFWTRI